MGKKTTTLSGIRIRYFGKHKELYHLALRTASKERADEFAAAIRKRGISARVVGKRGNWVVWESHFHYHKLG